MTQDFMIWKKTGKEMVCIPVGKFLFGEVKQGLELPEFWIDRTPVTNAEYKRFLDANPAYPVPFTTEVWAHTYNWDRQTCTFPPGAEQHPVVLVTQHNAVDYATWAGARLPTEREWEKAARGVDGRRYPWGAWDEGRCNTVETGLMTTTPVGCYSPAGDSLYGCVDMAGNVWEWTATEDDVGVIVRGGSFINDRLYARCAFRDWALPDSGLRLVGFRLVVSLP